MTAILRYTAFTDDPAGGNPAGVVLDASELSDARMQEIAAELGYSETAFATRREDGGYDVRYFSPEAEVPFCGHATIATGVALAERDGPGLRSFHTQAGEVPVQTSGEQRRGHRDAHERRPPRRGRPRGRPGRGAERTALERGRARPCAAAADRLRRRPPPGHRRGHARAPARPRLRLRRAQAADAGQRPDDRRPRAPRGRAHLPRAQPVPGRRRRRGPGDRRGRRGLRRLPARPGAVTPPATITIHQGVDMGRPSLLTVEIDDARPEIRVSGRAVAM